MPLKLIKQEFLLNNENKQRFINLLGDGLQVASFDIHNAQGDADVLIVQTAVTAALKQRTVLVGDDTDLLIILLHHYWQGELYFMSEPKSASLQSRRFLKTGHARDVLGVTNNILFVHAWLGCDKTSRVFGVGKGASLHLFKKLLIQSTGQHFSKTICYQG